MAEIVGRLPCDKCGSEQDVKKDKVKYFVNCSECGVMMVYQSRKAKAELKTKLDALKDDAPAEPPTPPPPTPKAEPDEWQPSETQAQDIDAPVITDEYYDPYGF